MRNTWYEYVRNVNAKREQIRRQALAVAAYEYLYLCISFRYSLVVPCRTVIVRMRVGILYPVPIIHIALVVLVHEKIRYCNGLVLKSDMSTFVAGTWHLTYSRYVFGVRVYVLCR